MPCTNTQSTHNHLFLQDTDRGVQVASVNNSWQPNPEFWAPLKDWGRNPILTLKHLQIHFILSVGRFTQPLGGVFYSLIWGVLSQELCYLRNQFPAFMCYVFNKMGLIKSSNIRKIKAYICNKTNDVCLACIDKATWLQPSSLIITDIHHTKIGMAY